MADTFGIDLGTTYSCLAKFENGKPVVIQAEQGVRNSLASAVYFGPDGETVVGDDAKAYVQTEGHRVIQFIKREIGKPALPHEIDGRSYNAIEISALILKKIVKYAAEQGEIVKDVVITCPAYFGNEERDATKKAGQLAGLNVLELINEPTAAAISYALGEAGGTVKDENVVVYDLGGGTFDVTVLEIKAKSNGVPSCTVLATDGDDKLGGKDWDMLLFSLIKDKMMSENGLDELSMDDENAIRAIVEKTKHKLSVTQSADVRCHIAGSSMTCTVTREEFETVSAGLLKQTTDCLDRILALPKLANVRIDKILLVGGSSNMPMVKNTIAERYGSAAKLAAIRGLSAPAVDSPVDVGLKDAECAVCKGAAIYANLLKKAKKNTGGFMFGDEDEAPAIEVQDIASRTFGVDVNDNSVDDGIKLDNLIYKGDKIPASITKTYYPVVDNQRGVLFYIYESNITDRYGYFPLNVPKGAETGDPIDPDPAWGLKYLGKLFLKFPPGVTKETALPTTMSVSGSGIHVRVENSITGDVQEVDIEFTNNEVDMDNNHINALFIE